MNHSTSKNARKMKAPLGDVVVIPNLHAEDRGPFPLWLKRRSEFSYFGYYENSDGEQWVFVATEHGIRVIGGAAGWEHTFSKAKPIWDALWQSVMQTLWRPFPRRSKARHFHTFSIG